MKDGSGYRPTRRRVTVRKHELADIADAIETARRFREREDAEGNEA